MMTNQAARVLNSWPFFKWRHHGTGMLQAYFPSDPTTRVHVWHPSLLLPGMTTSGAMHNHRFGFESHILLGSIDHTHLAVRPCRRGYGAHQLFTIENASKGRDVDIIPGKRCTLVMGSDFRYGAGTKYSIKKWDFHWARPTHELAVTVVELHDKSEDKVASLVAPYGTKPVHAFRPESLRADLADTEILKTALEQLLEHYG